MAIQLGTFEIPRDPTIAWRLHSETGSISLGVPMQLRWMVAPRDLCEFTLFPNVKAGRAVTGSPYLGDHRGRRPYMPQLTKTIAYVVRNNAMCHLELITAYVNSKAFHVVTKVVGPTYIETIVHADPACELAHAIENPEIMTLAHLPTTRSVVNAIISEAEARSGGELEYDIKTFIMPLIEDTAIVLPWRNTLRHLRAVAHAAQAAMSSPWAGASHGALLATAIRPLIATSVVNDHVRDIDTRSHVGSVGGAQAAVIAPETVALPDDQSLLLDPMAIVKDANVGAIAASYAEADFGYILHPGHPLPMAAQSSTMMMYGIDNIVGSMQTSSLYQERDTTIFDRIATLVVHQYAYANQASLTTSTTMRVSITKTRGEEIIATLYDHADKVLGYAYLDLVEVMVFGPSLEWFQR